MKDKNRRVLWACSSCEQMNRIELERWSEGAKCGRCKKDLVTNHPLSLDRKGFEQVISGGGLPVLVDFWAPWCGPCRMIAPVLESMAKEFDGRLLIVKVNTDENPTLAGTYKIQGIPTMIMFQGGKELHRQSGAMPEPMMRQWILRAIA